MWWPKLLSKLYQGEKNVGKKMPNVETLRELTADELDQVAGGLGKKSTITGEGQRDLDSGDLEGILDLKGFAKK
jgi:hypothetical protein